MEIIGTILSVALVLFAITGVIAILGVFTALVMVKNGGLITLGYAEDDDEIIKDNNNEEEK